MVLIYPSVGILKKPAPNDASDTHLRNPVNGTDLKSAELLIPQYLLCPMQCDPESTCTCQALHIYRRELLNRSGCWCINLELWSVWLDLQVVENEPELFRGSLSAAHAKTGPRQRCF